MKIRNGFVSNSSSSSFIIPKDQLTNDQIRKIYNHIEESQKHLEYFNFGYFSHSDKWNISESEKFISGFCFMNNFSMFEFLINYLNIDGEIIIWND